MAKVCIMHELGGRYFNTIDFNFEEWENLGKRLIEILQEKCDTTSLYPADMFMANLRAYGYAPFIGEYGTASALRPLAKTEKSMYFLLSTF